MLKISILGSNSFIAKHFIRHLSERKDVSLTMFGRNSVSAFEDLRNIQGDFNDSECLQKVLEGQEIVYNFISQTIPATSWDNPFIEIEKNLIPFLKFIEIAATKGVKKICFASSGGTIYGLQQDLLTEENLTDPFSPYGIIKRTIESFLLYAKLKYNINFDIYRMSNVYGEGQNIGKGLGFINTSLENIANNRPVVIYGDGENIRDYIYVQDVSKLLTLSIKKDFENSNIYNLSSNQPISLNDLIKLMKKILDIDFEVKYKPTRASDNQRVILDNTKIMRHFEKTSLTPLEEGIKKTYDYLKNQTSYFQKST